MVREQRRNSIRRSLLHWLLYLDWALLFTQYFRRLSCLSVYLRYLL